MTAEVIYRKAIKITNSIVNMALLLSIIIVVAFAGYALWDSSQLHQAADKMIYEVYKPTPENEGKSFKELQALNSDIIAWLNIYGTNIDYPVTQGADNMKYLNTNPEGQYSLSGAIFLDSENSKEFDDFNSIFYGHHMEKKVMFGELGQFSNKEMFETHRYGTLYYNGKDHGIDFFAFLHISAYDKLIYAPGISEDQRQDYLNSIVSDAIHKREIEITEKDQIVLLVTCSSESTNGRDVLVGKITDDIKENAFLNMNLKQKKNTLNKTSIAGQVKEVHLVNIVLAGLSTVFITVVLYIRKKRGAKVYEIKKK